MTAASDKVNEIGFRSQASGGTGRNPLEPGQRSCSSSDQPSANRKTPGAYSGQLENRTAVSLDGSQSYDLNPRWLLAALAIVVGEIGGMYFLAYAMMAP